MFLRTKTHVALILGFLQSSAKLLNWIAYAGIFILFHTSAIFLLNPLFLYLIYWSAIYWNKVIYHKQQQGFTTVAWNTTTKMPCFALTSHLKDIWFALPRQLFSWPKNKKKNWVGQSKNLLKTPCFSLKDDLTMQHIVTSISFSPFW